MIEHRNYSRQFLQQFARYSTGLKGYAPENAEAIEALKSAARVAVDSQKFTLPDGGEVFEDPDFRALEIDQDLRLPYPTVALEYLFPPGPVPKRVLFLEETLEGVHVIPLFSHDGLFLPGRPFLLKNKNFIARELKSAPTVRIHARSIHGAEANNFDARVVLGFLNALSCSNVAVERGPAPKQGAKLKNSLPFDTYHTLVLRGPKSASESRGFGGHRSPREHLRRGHIRRLESGNKVWVNATVVNAGAPGKIVKDYALR